MRTCRHIHVQTERYAVIQVNRHTDCMSECLRTYVTMTIIPPTRKRSRRRRRRSWCSVASVWRVTIIPNCLVSSLQTIFMRTCDVSMIMPTVAAVRQANTGHISAGTPMQMTGNIPISMYLCIDLIIYPSIMSVEVGQLFDMASLWMYIHEHIYQWCPIINTAFYVIVGTFPSNPRCFDACLYIFMSAFLYVCMSIGLHICVLDCMSSCLHVCRCAHLYIFVSIRLSVCLYVWVYPHL